MNKKAIVLADNSYTIRRIVELSFSEIENIEVRSFENGSGIKEKLLQLKPAVVIVDIKLPETNGYDICRFINETPALNQCRVFLMKGSFEPVDNEMIKNLKYEDIVTKPFDSNALVSAVMKIVNGEEIKAPSKVAGAGPVPFRKISLKLNPTPLTAKISAFQTFAAKWKRRFLRIALQPGTRSWSGMKCFLPKRSPRGPSPSKIT